MNAFTQESHPRRWKKWIIALFCFFMVIFLAFAAFMPSLLSTARGKAMFLSYINKKYSERIEIHHITLRWFGSQEILGLKVEGAGLQPLFACERIDSNSPLWKIIFHKELGDITFLSPHVSIPKGTSNRKGPEAPRFASRSDTKRTKAKQDLKFSYYGNLFVQNGQIDAANEGLDPFSFQNIDVQIHVPNFPEPIKFSASGNTLQNNSTGHFQIAGSMERLESAKPSIDLQAKLMDIPVRGLDQIVALAKPGLEGHLYSLLGPSLNLAIRGQISEEILDISLQAKSQQLEAEIQTETKNSSIMLKNPAKFFINLSPTFINLCTQRLAFLKPLLSNSAASIQVSLNQFLLPISKGLVDYAGMSFNSSFEIFPQMQKNMPIKKNGSGLKNIKGAFSSNKLSTGIFFGCDASAEIEDLKTSIGVKGVLEELFAERMQLSSSVRIRQLPTLWIDLWAGQDQFLSELLGKSLDVDLEIKNSASAKSHIQLQASAQQFKLPGAKFTFDVQGLKLDAPFEMTYMPPKAWLSQLFKGPGLKIQNDQPLQFQVSQFSLPENLDVQKMNLQMKILAPKIFFNELTDSPPSLSNLECLMDMRTWDKIHLDVKEQSFQFTLDTALKDRGRVLVVEKPLDIRFILQPAWVDPFFKDSYRSSLISPTPVTIRLSPFSLPLSRAALGRFAIEGEIKTDKVEIGLQAQSKNAVLQLVDIRFEMDGARKRGKASFQSEILMSPFPPGKIQSQITLDNLKLDESFNMSEATIMIKAQVSRLSTEFLELVSGRIRSIGPLLGPALDLTLDWESAPSVQTIQFGAKSQWMDAGASFQLENNLLQLVGQKASLNCILNPEGYEALDRWITGQNPNVRPFQLNTPSNIRLTIQRLVWPAAIKEQCSLLFSRLPCFQFDLPQLEVDWSASIDKLSLIDKTTKQTALVRDLKLSMLKPTSKAPFQLNVDGAVFSKNNTAVKEGQIHVSATIDSARLTSDAAPLQTSKIQVDAQINQMPASILDFTSRIFGNTDFPFATIFGNTLNAGLNVELQDLSGAVQCKLNTPNVRASLKGKLSKGILSLDEALYAQMLLSPEFSQMMLKDADRFPFTAISAKNPFTLQVNPEGFNVALRPFSMQSVNIPNLRLELGQVKCQNRGNLHFMLNLLKSQQFSEQKEMNVWFAPMDLHVEQGIVDCERTEILVADTYDVCVWGKTDLVQNDVKMILGLTEDCLKKAFGIKNLPQRYVLQIPIKGKLNDIKINSGAATAKIAALLAWQQKSAAAGMLGGSTGALLGGFLDKLGAIPDLSGKAPPPKHPFPWELDKAGSELDEKDLKKRASSKKRAIKKGDKPLKQLLKLLR